MGIISSIFRRLTAFLLGFALLGALWEGSLLNLSSRATATSIMSEVGVEVINPVLLGHSFGLSQSAFTTLQQQCSGSLAVPGVKIAIPCSEIAGKDPDSGLRQIYRDVAAQYYDKGADGVFNVSPEVLGVLSGTPILPQNMGAVTAPNGQQINIPHLPDIPLLPTSLGFNIKTLTAQGHADVTTRALWFGGAALILLVLLALTSKGWKRVTNVSGALAGAALPGVLGIGVVWFLVNHFPDQSRGFSTLLGLVGGAFIPIYGGVFLLGIALLVASIIARITTKSVKVARSVDQRVRRPGDGGERQRPAPAPMYGEPRPRYVPPSPVVPNPAPPPYARRPAAEQWQQPPADPAWPQSPAWDAPARDAPPYQGQAPYLGQAPYQGQAPYPGQRTYQGQQPDPDLPLPPDYRRDADQPPYPDQSPYPANRPYPRRDALRPDAPGWDANEPWPPRQGQ